MLIIICWSFLDCLILFLYNIPCVFKNVFLCCMCWPVYGKCSFLILNSSLFPILTTFLYLVQEADTDENQGTLTFEEFCVFYKMMSLRRDLYLLLLSYSDKKEHLTVEELAQFLKVEQKVPLGCGTGCARLCLRAGVRWLADVRICYVRIHWCIALRNRLSRSCQWIIWVTCVVALKDSDKLKPSICDFLFCLCWIWMWVFAYKEMKVNSFHFGLPDNIFLILWGISNTINLSFYSFMSV